MLIALAITAYLFCALVAYHIEKRIVDAEMPALCAAVWPLRLAELAFLASLGSVYGAGWLANKGFGWLFGKTDAAVDRMVDGMRGGLRGIRERRLAKRLEQKRSRIMIPEGAVLGSEEYRRLKPMIESFERGLPIHERE
jgi:hypothetical protein